MVLTYLWLNYSLEEWLKKAGFEVQRYLSNSTLASMLVNSGVSTTHLGLDKSRESGEIMDSEPEDSVQSQEPDVMV